VCVAQSWMINVHGNASFFLSLYLFLIDPPLINFFIIYICILRRISEKKKERKEESQNWVAKGVSGTRTAGQAKTKKCNPGQFVWHIEWMLAVHSFYHTFGLTAHSFSFLSCPHTVAARDLWSCVWEKERKRNGESSFFSFSGQIFHLFISEDGPEKKKDKGLSVWAVKVVTRLSARREAIGTY
jgi:hypothetical protein